MKRCESPKRPFFYLTLIELVWLIMILAISHILWVATYAALAALPYDTMAPNVRVVDIFELGDEILPPVVQFQVMLACLWFLFIWNFISAIKMRTHGRAKFAALYLIFGLLIIERTYRFYAFMFTNFSV